MNVPALRFKEFSNPWSETSIGDIAGKVTSGATPSTLSKEFWNGDVRWMNSGELNLKKVFEVENRITELALKKSSTKLLPKNCVLIGLAGQGKTRGTVAMNLIELCTNQSIAAIHPNPSKFDEEFVYHNLDFRYEELRSMSTGDGGRGGLNLGIIKSIPIKLPSIPEQTKIANFLTAVDQKVTQLTQKHDLLTQYKKGVMQQIFSQELRFKDDDGRDFPEWELCELGKFIDEFKEKSSVENQHKVLTSARTGLVPQDEYFEEGRLSRKDNVGFNIVPQGYVTYRSRSDDGIFKFNLNTLGYTGIISTYYPVFNLKSCSNKFFIELSEFYKCDFGKYSVGTSQTVLSLNALKKIEFMFPCLDEQTKIANFLKSIDDKITVIHSQLKALNQYKQGLFQQMFV